MSKLNPVKADYIAPYFPIPCTVIFWASTPATFKIIVSSSVTDMFSLLLYTCIHRSKTVQIFKLCFSFKCFSTGFEDEFASLVHFRGVRLAGSQQCSGEHQRSRRNQRGIPLRTSTHHLLYHSRNVRSGNQHRHSKMRSLPFSLRCSAVFNFMMDAIFQKLSVTLPLSSFYHVCT